MHLISKQIFQASKLRIAQFVFLALMFVALPHYAQGQGLDLAKTPISQITDQQMDRVFLEATSRGLTIDQVVTQALAGGLPPSSAPQLRQKLQQAQQRTLLGSTTSGDTGALNTGVSGLQSLSTVSSAAAIITPEIDSVRLERQKLRESIFGMSYFFGEAGSPILQLQQNLPTPSNYQLGAGDQLVIMVWGAAEQVYDLTINKDGFIMIDNLGPVFLNGLTIEEAQRLLRDRLSSIYSGLKRRGSDDVNTFMQVSLGQVRTISVNVVGEVEKPGSYPLSSFSTVFNALYTAGGPGINGSLREIRVMRGGKQVAAFDFYDVLLWGDQSSNIRLQDQDVVLVAPYVNRIEIEGSTKRSGLFEAMDGETVADAIGFAGGFTATSYRERVTILRNTGVQKRVENVASADFSTFTLMDGDKLSFGVTLDRFENRVEVLGAVFRPGNYRLENAPTLSALIREADGLREDAFRNRVTILRTRDDLTQELLSVDLGRVISDPDDFDIALKKDDIVNVSSIFDLKEEFVVSIDGPVLNPGEYTFAEGMTLEDLIFQAGGFLEAAAPNKIEIARRITEKNQSEPVRGRIATASNTAQIFSFSVDRQLRMTFEDRTFQIMPFDKVYIRQLPNYETQREMDVTGEIQFPGTYALSSRVERVSDIIRRAGGITIEAYLEGATLYRKPELIQQEEVEEFDVFGNIRIKETPPNRINIDLQRVLDEPGGDFDLIVEEGDRLVIPKLLQTVTVQGGVYFPTTLRYERGLNVKDYVNRSGGFSTLAYRKRVYIVYANGEADRAKRFLVFRTYPKVEPGASIVIPEKEAKRELTAQEVYGIASSVVATATLIVTTILQFTR